MSATFNPKLYQYHSTGERTPTTVASSVHSSGIHSYQHPSEYSPFHAEEHIGMKKEAGLSKFRSEGQTLFNTETLMAFNSVPCNPSINFPSRDGLFEKNFEYSTQGRTTFTTQQNRYASLNEIDANFDRLFESENEDFNDYGLSRKMPPSPHYRTLNDIRVTNYNFIASPHFLKNGTERIKTLERSFTDQRVSRKCYVRQTHSFFLDSEKVSNLKKETIARNKEIGEKIFWNTNILECLLTFLNCKDILNFSKVHSSYKKNNKYRKLFTVQLHRLVLKNLSKREQYEYWDSFLNFKLLKKEHRFSFEKRVSEPCEFISEIDKDLDRTLPEYECYSTGKGKRDLCRTLIAITNTKKDVGYIQGLNSIAGVLLRYLHQEESFWVMLYILEKLNFKDILKDNLLKVNYLNYQFQIFLQNYVPEIADYFKANSIGADYFTTPWFIPLFSHSLSVPNIIKVWNFFFLKGTSFLIQLALAIFSKYKDEILSMDLDEVGPFIKTSLRKMRENDDSIFSLALSFKVTKRLMDGLETYYHQNRSNLKLVKNKFGKLKWEVIPLCEKLSRSLNDIGFINKSEDHASSLVQKNSGPTVQSLVNMIKGELPAKLKKIFTKEDSTDKTIHQRSKSRGLTDPATSITRKEFKIFTKKPRGLSMINVNTDLDRKRVDKLPEINETSHLTAAEETDDLVVVEQELEDIRVNSRVSTVINECYPRTSVHQNMRMSIKDKLLPRTLLESPLLGNEEEDCIRKRKPIFYSERHTSKKFEFPNCDSLTPFKNSYQTIADLDRNSATQNNQRRFNGRANTKLNLDFTTNYYGKNHF